MSRRALLLVLPALLASLAGCGGEADDGTAVDVDPFTSDAATLLQFEFDGELVTSVASPLRPQVKAQLFYLVGQLNALHSVARLERITLLTLSSAAAGGGLTRVKYRARIPVAWGSKTDLPTSFALTLPRRVDAAGLAAFWSKYKEPCGEHDGHEVTAGNFWYHYRPAQAGCALPATDAVTATAAVSVHASNTAAKYPEYHRVWEDRTLRVVAVFGKYEKGATSDGDAGISAYNEFVQAVRARLSAAALTPAITTAPGAKNPDVTLEAQLPAGRRAVISALLVDEVQSAPLSFDRRYAELTPGADLILYNGHAGLGANVRALQAKGQFFPGQYQIVFFDGCDTFAYLDDALAARRAPLNPDDPSGTKYLDVVTNAMPAYFSNMPEASMALIGALLDDQNPRSYNAIFRGVSKEHVVVATGEEDNVFRPGLAPARWNALAEEGFVAKGETVAYSTELLPAGRYLFTLVPDPARPGGDADLRVRAGAAPDLSLTWKCRSYTGNSNERCLLTLAAPAKVFLTVTGDKAGVESAFELRGNAL